MARENDVSIQVIQSDVDDGAAGGAAPVNDRDSSGNPVGLREQFVSFFRGIAGVTFTTGADPQVEQVRGAAAVGNDGPVFNFPIEAGSVDDSAIRTRLGAALRAVAFVRLEMGDALERVLADFAAEAQAAADARAQGLLYFDGPR